MKQAFELAHQFQDFKDAFLRSFMIRLKYQGRHSGFFWRALLSLLLGFALLMNDETTSHDRRFQIRGEKRLHERIVLITIDSKDLLSDSSMKTINPNLMVGFDTTDSFYWDAKLWENLLSNILKQSPTRVGVTLFFSNSLNYPSGADESQIFYDPRIIWAGVPNPLDRTIVPLFGKIDLSNVGTIEFTRDQDGVIRRFIPSANEITDFVEQMTDQKLSAQMINYRGIKNAVIEVSASDVLNQRVPADFFKDKYVLIGGELKMGYGYLTPFGETSRQIMLAQVVDNSIGKRWIQRLHWSIYLLGLIGILILTVHVVSRFPQTAASFILIWMMTLITSLSVWIFDTFSIWVPIVSPVVQIFTTWILFIGYEANRIERRNFELQQEKKYSKELEQLKNNFVSLISHDLKTPIAKIQAIVDRLMSSPSANEIQGDLLQLRLSGEELNRYIQSIIKLLRIESQDFRLNIAVCDFNQIVENVITKLKPLASEKKIQIVPDLEPLFSIEADETLIHEVVLNLIENAIKYSPGEAFIHVHTMEQDGQVFFSVKDQGSGIPPEELPLVWGKFVRGRDQNLKTKGSGLGLYLVKYFIELHGGSVKIESELNKGTTVTFSLPLDEGEV